MWEAGQSLDETCYRPLNADDLYSDSIVYLGNREAITTLGTNQLSGSQVFLMIRDPRDCLVSMYFSFLGSHPAPAHLTPKQVQQWNEHKRLLLEKTSIDEYVIEKASNYKDNLLKMLIFSRKAETSFTVRYEDYITNKKTLCSRIIDTLESLTEGLANIPPERLNEISQAHNIIPALERPNHHIRRALPGDHKNKLSSRTIQELNQIFSEFMQEYDYS
jgi:hypothetical protein